jgi:hypothetical protein
MAPSAFSIQPLAFSLSLLLPEPNHNLGVGGGTQGAQTARILEAYDYWLLVTDD